MKTELFNKIKVGANNIDNRVVMAPLTRNRAGDGNVPQLLNAKYYEQRATAGFIVTEATQISPQGVGYPGTPGIHSSEQIEGWKIVTEAVHKKGGKIFLQLWHVGRISHPSLQPDGALPVSASALKPDGETMTYEGMKPFVTPRALEVSEVKGVVKDYVTAAKNAIEAGFSGVEIHAANGYLIDQFLRDGTNKRDDQYGGSLVNRLRFLSEVVKGVTDAIGSDLTGIRISPENSFNDISDSDPQKTFNRVAEFLSTYKLAYLHAVEGDFVTGEKKLDYRQIRDRFKGVYVANAGYNAQTAAKSIENGDADLVSFGSLYIANPDLVERFKNDDPLNTPDESTYYGGDGTGYTDYPALEG
jgi:N-ethylmaleimide reductase